LFARAIRSGQAAIRPVEAAKRLFPLPDGPIFTVLDVVPMNTPRSLEVTTLPIKWLRIPAACAYNGMSRAKLYQLLAEGQIKSICVRKKGNVRGLRLFSADSIDTFLESCTEESTVPFTT
jgi:hypothetical protein